MTPFRDKEVKWKEEDNATGRYKNVNGLKFDIIRQTVVIQQEEMPKHFLADTPEEAEALYCKYSGMINGMAYNYALATGLQKFDLFIEALIGLGRAYASVCRIARVPSTASSQLLIWAWRALLFWLGALSQQ